MQCKIIRNSPKMDNCQKVFRDVLKSVLRVQRVSREILKSVQEFLESFRRMSRELASLGCGLPVLDYSQPLLMVLNFPYYMYFKERLYFIPVMEVQLVYVIQCIYCINQCGLCAGRGIRDNKNKLANLGRLKTP